MSSSLATSAAECVCTPHIICSGNAWCPGHYLSQPVLPLFRGIHHICLFSWYYTYSIHHLQLAVDLYWCNTHHTQKSKHTSYFKFCHSSGRPSIFNLTYLWYPLIAAQWHNRHAAIKCFSLQSHDTISCQTCCYLIFFGTSLCTCQRYKAQNLVQGTHPQKGVQLGCIKICHSFWTIIMPMV